MKQIETFLELNVRLKVNLKKLENIVVTALKEKCSLEFLSKITQTSVKKIKAIAKKHKIEIDE